ncbi:MAG: iron-sulfur cluster assembly accessory protein [Myxococcota bacterium]|jgi:iron-sulfur cluster assembly accessory protein
MLEVTERAAARICEVIREQPGLSGLRVGLRDGGCSGYAYLMAFEAEADEDDMVLEVNGAQVYVHPLHVPFLAGSKLGWAEEEFQSGFHLDNPNVSRVCGCGESFDLKMD